MDKTVELNWVLGARTSPSSEHYLSLLDNAVSSIRMGVEDFGTGSKERLLSSIRNLYAGILLLFKYKLVQLANGDETVIKARVKPKLSEAGELLWVGKGLTSIDYGEIRQRFADFKVEVDWKTTDKIQKERNNIEHYYSQSSEQVVRGVIADTLLLFRDFCQEELNQSASDLIGNDTWQKMLKIKTVYDDESARRSVELARINFYTETSSESIASAGCTQCGSNLLVPTCDSSNPGDGLQRQPEGSVFVCRSCGNEEEFEELLSRAMDDEHSTPYREIAQGADPDLIDCPECNVAAYLMTDQQCSACGHEANHTCSRCECDIPFSELDDDTSLCGYCAHMFERLRSE